MGKHVTSRSKSASVRERLPHPVIDVDGHTIEFIPAFFDALREVGGSGMVDRYLSYPDNRFNPTGWYRQSWDERRDNRTPRLAWWPFPARNTLDRATATVPRLLRSRMDEMGLDFSVLYPSLGLSLLLIDNEEIRRIACRAFNRYYAEFWREQADRMTPVAVIPMFTPQEAIEELEYAVNTLGMKSVLIAGHVRRPVPAIARKYPEASRHAFYLDTYGLDSPYDYDPFWAKCVELKVAPTSHAPGMGWGSRRSISSFMYNHIGHFAAAGEALAKSLFFGGVTRRFPALRVAFLECGAAWACTLYNDLVGHWTKRNRDAVQHYNPAELDRKRYAELLSAHGGERVARDIAAQIELGLTRDPVEQPIVDEWSACGIERAEDIRDLFVPHFFFGCEADDPMTALAFDRKLLPFGAPLNAVYSSDIGHWDVPDMSEVLEEAWESVEHGLLTEESFRAFTFTNPAKLLAETNPDYFKGTAVEGDIARLARETAKAC